jgi:hypothetical protein
MSATWQVGWFYNQSFGIWMNTFQYMQDEHSFILMTNIFLTADRQGIHNAWGETLCI